LKVFRASMMYDAGYKFLKSYQLSNLEVERQSKTFYREYMAKWVFPYEALLACINVNDYNIIEYLKILVKNKEQIPETVKTELIALMEYCEQKVSGRLKKQIEISKNILRLK